MLTLNSFLSFFSFSVSKEALQCASCSFVDEINENNEERQCWKSGLFSVISCNSFLSLFVSPQDRAGSMVQNHALCGQFLACFSPSFSGTISGSQPTGCGHTLTRCPLPGWWVAAAPSTPKRPKP